MRKTNSIQLQSVSQLDTRGSIYKTSYNHLRIAIKVGRIKHKRLISSLRIIFVIIQSYDDCKKFCKNFNLCLIVRQNVTKLSSFWLSRKTNSMQLQLVSQLDTMGSIYKTSYNCLKVTVMVMCIYYKIPSIRKDLFSDQNQVFNWWSIYKTHEH